MDRSLRRGFTDFCVCTRDYGALTQAGDGLTCTTCEAEYAIDDGILILLPEYADELRTRFLASYEHLATVDLERPLEGRREVRHVPLIKFVGDVRGKNVLDVGSSNAQYLAAIDAGYKVALDLALPFLRSVPADGGIARVCADAEYLPVKPGFFDVIILSDVLEHVLDPERLVARVAAVSTPDTRVIVHVPWEEDLTSYRDSEFEFTHLRTFDTHSAAILFRDFYPVRERATYPSLEQPVPFRLKRLLPRPVYDLVLYRYFRGGLASREERRRMKWIEELPRRERLLLRLYPGKFRMLEFRLLTGSWMDRTERTLSRARRLMPTVSR